MRQAGGLIGLFVSIFGIVWCIIASVATAEDSYRYGIDEPLLAAIAGGFVFLLNIIISSVALSGTNKLSSKICGALLVGISVAVMTTFGSEMSILHLIVALGGILLLASGFVRNDQTTPKTIPSFDKAEPMTVQTPLGGTDSLTAEAKKAKEALDVGLLSEDDYKAKMEELRKKYKEAQVPQPPQVSTRPLPSEPNQFIQFISNLADWYVRLMGKAWQALKPKISSGASALGEEAKKFSEQNFPEGKPTAEGFFKLAPPIYTLAFGIGSFVASMILAAFLTGSKLGFLVWLMIFWAALFVLLLVAYVKTKGAENNHQKHKDTGS